MDLNVRAFRTVHAALAEPGPPNKRKQANKKGGLIGGPLRAKSMTPERRAEIARNANAARWRKKSTAPSVER